MSTVRRHDHRSSLWLLRGQVVTLGWCYQCGAWRDLSVPSRKWHRPTGIGGPNPAMRNKAMTPKATKP